MNTQDKFHIFATSLLLRNIDHGKSTISDRAFWATHTVEERDMESQLWTLWTWAWNYHQIKRRSRHMTQMMESAISSTWLTPRSLTLPTRFPRSWLPAKRAKYCLRNARRGGSNSQTPCLPISTWISFRNQDWSSVCRPEEVRAEIEDVLAIPADDAVCSSGKIRWGYPWASLRLCVLGFSSKGERPRGTSKALILTHTWPVQQ